MTDITKLERTIRETVSREFKNVRIVSVKVREDSEWSNGDVLRIDVVFEGEATDIDARKLSGIVRQVRPQLVKLGELGFPLFSFISKSDVGSRKLALA